MATVAEGVDALVREHLAWIAEARPVEATFLGEHGGDDRLPELTREELDGWSRRLGELGDAARRLADSAADADPGTHGDLRLLTDALDARRFWLDERARFSTDPLVGLDLATEGVHELLRRADLADEPRPWLERALQRAAGVPRLLEQAYRLLDGVPAPHRDVTLRRVAGAASLFRDHLVRRAGGVRSAGAGDGGDVCTRAAEAVERYGRALDETDPDPHAWRLGAAAHARALRHAIGSDLPVPSIVERAERALRETRAELAELAAELWAELLPGEPRPADTDALVRGAVGALGSQDASDRHGLVTAATRAVDEAYELCAGSGLFPMPARGDLAVVEVPEYQQGLFVAYLQPAPPLEPDAGSSYYLSPVPDDWDEARAASFLREYNRWALRALAVHEAYPGHALQLSVAGRHPRLARRLFTSPAFAEGWAVYCERLVQEHGFDERRYRLVELKMALRVAANALLDAGMHAGELDDEGARELLVDRALQEPAEVDGKIVRAKVTSGQLASYFVGSEEVTELRRDVERVQGAAFDLRAFHDELLSHGTPPVSVLRGELWGGSWRAGVA